MPGFGSKSGDLIMPKRVFFNNGDEVVFKSVEVNNITNIAECKTFFGGITLKPLETISYIDEVI